MNTKEARKLLLRGLTDAQQDAVSSEHRRVVVVAGAGSGKTEVMARRIAWWVAIGGVPKDQIIALTFMEKAAEEIKFRVRKWIGHITPDEEDVNLGGMYVGTIHGYCLEKTRQYWPDAYHNFDILDEAARVAFILRGFNGVLGLRKLRTELDASQSATVDQFISGYDQLHEHNLFQVSLGPGAPPYRLGQDERDWCSQARLLTDVGDDGIAQAFSLAAARYYAFLRCRRFLDFSTSQTEFLRNLAGDSERLRTLHTEQVHVVVDEVQDINPVQRDMIFTVVGRDGRLTAVGDHRQAIYGFRGAKVEIIGDLWRTFRNEPDAEIIDLRENFRSTPRIIHIANQWASTITPAGGMETPDMRHGKSSRVDQHASHVALVGFDERQDEAEWIASAIKALVPTEKMGAEHDRRDGSVRGISLADIAILVRSSTDVRTYMKALEAAGIPSVVRAGPDLFSQPEVLFFISALAISAGVDQFFGAPHNRKSLPSRIAAVLGCPAEPEQVLYCAAKQLQDSELGMDEATVARVSKAASLLSKRILDGESFSRKDMGGLRSRKLQHFLSSGAPVRRVFPQQIYHWLLTEGGVDSWDAGTGLGEAAMFHLGTLSGLITGIETPGWTSAGDYKWQIIGLCQYGAEGGRTPEQPLIVQPDAATISTVHGAKGLEFAAVFLADVCARRFPSSYARRAQQLPISGPIVGKIDVDGLSDNENYDAERRLMYVALTRAERFLVVSHSGRQQSKFIRELRPIFREVGAVVSDDPQQLLEAIRHAPLEHTRETQLSTSFSDLRYYLECPHDFYLRKVLGFAPTIDQAFGYGRGVHNLLRAVHSNPKYWAELSRDRKRLEQEIRRLIDEGLFYLRYTTGEPAENMRRKGIRVVADYIEEYSEELSQLVFEPEKEFETLVEYEDGEGGAMVSGAVDIVRLDDPPRVTLIDFKSGEPNSDRHQSLDEYEMRLQVGIYAVAAKKELEYEPEKGLVRYLDVEYGAGENGQLEVPLDREAVQAAKRTVLETAVSIRDRQFFENPRRTGTKGEPRCRHCDFLSFCGMEQARETRRESPTEY